MADWPLFGTTIGSSANRKQSYSPSRGRFVRTCRPASLTRGDVVLGALSISFDEHGGGEEESSAHHGHKGAEQQRELQRAELPQEGVGGPQGVGHLQKTRRHTANTAHRVQRCFCGRGRDTRTTPIRYGLPASPSRCEMTICSASAVERRVGMTTY